MKNTTKHRSARANGVNYAAGESRFDKYATAVVGSRIAFPHQEGDRPLRRYMEALSCRTRLNNKFGIETGKPEAIGNTPGCYIKVINNPALAAAKMLQKEDTPTVAPTNPPPKAVAVPTATPCRITAKEQDARDFFALAFAHSLALEDAPKAYEKAKQATELFRRHIAEYKD